MRKMIEAKGIRKYLGLMFRTRNTTPLIFNFPKEVSIPIHSFCVFFSFQASWFDYKGDLIEQKVIRPFSFGYKPSKPFKRIIEVPL